MPTSPDILNYFVGKGTVSFTPEGGVKRDLGNAPEFELTPEIETLEHFSSRSGVRTKDREVILEKTLTLRLVLDELTPENLALALLGTAEENTSGDTEFTIFSESEVKGEIELVGTNDIGNRYTVLLPSVSFIPGAGLNLISDEFGQVELTGEVLEVASSFGTITQIQVAS